jgi:hypothetical protein
MHVWQLLERVRFCLFIALQKPLDTIATNAFKVYICSTFVAQKTLNVVLCQHLNVHTQASSYAKYIYKASTRYMPLKYANSPSSGKKLTPR